MNIKHNSLETNKNTTESINAPTTIEESLPLLPGASSINVVEETSSVTLKQRFCNKRFINLIILGLGWMLLFSSYQPAESYMSTIHGDKGFYSLTAIYVTFGFGTFLSPTVEGLLGPKLSIILSSLPYSLFVLSVGFPLFWVTTGLAVLVGFSASLLWIANGDLLTTIGQDEIGLYSGIFNGLYGLNLIIGNFLYAILNSNNLEIWIIFSIFCSFSLVASILFLFLQPVKRELKTEEDVVKVHPIKKIIISIKNTFLMLFDKRVILLIPIFILSGYGMALFYARIPQLIGEELSGWCMTLLGITELISSIFIGKISDTIGVYKIMYAALLLQAVSIGLTFVMHHYPPYLLFVTTAVIGFADSALGTQIYGVIGSTFAEDEITDSFASYKFIYAFSAAFSMVANIFLDFFYMQMIMIGLIASGILGFTILCCLPKKK